MTIASYKPNKTSMEVWIEIQNTAKLTGKTIKELSLEMGFSCGYEWFKALKEGSL